MTSRPHFVFKNKQELLFPSFRINQQLQMIQAAIYSANLCITSLKAVNYKIACVTTKWVLQKKINFLLCLLITLQIKLWPYINIFFHFLKSIYQLWVLGLYKMSMTSKAEFCGKSPVQMFISIQFT